MTMKLRCFTATLIILVSGSSLSFSQAVLVKDINQNPTGITEDNVYTDIFCKCGNYLYFVFNNSLPLYGRELWRTDGTPEGTVMIKDLNQGFANGAQNSYTCYNNKLFFSGNNGTTGSELWTTDGTALGTTLVKDVVAGTTGSSPNNFVVFQNKLYFFINANGTQLWQTDGTSDGTSLVQILNQGGTPLLEAVAGNFFYFVTRNSVLNRAELWRSNGTQEGTIVLKHSSILDFESIGAVDNKLFFSCKNTNNIYELWNTDGTPSGTSLVKALSVSQINRFKAFNNKLLFSSSNSLWTSDGTADGTIKLFNGCGNANATVIYENYFYGLGYDFFAGSNYIFRTDGTAAGTTRLVNLGGSLANISLYNEIPVVNGKFVIPVFDPTYGREIGVSDRTQDGTHLLKDIFSGTGSSLPKSFKVLNNKAVFIAKDSLRGAELWITDGTEPGTQLLKEAITGTDDSSLGGGLTATSDQIFYFATSQQGSLSFTTDLWKSDGTKEGTLLHHDIPPQSPTGPTVYLGKNDSSIYYFANLKVFRVTNSNSPVMLKDFNVPHSSGSFGFNTSGNHNIGNKFIWLMSLRFDSNTVGNELYVTDGTEAGTHLLKDINPGALSGIQNSQGAILNNKLIFSANNGSQGYELWSTDGTEAGTLIVKDIFEGGSSSQPSSFAALGQYVFFAANDGIKGSELWKTDGTAAGTTLVMDINTSAESKPKSLTRVGNHILFTAYNETIGWALWKTDGTQEGTVLVKDISPYNDEAVYPDEFRAVGDKLFFRANDGEHGVELWISDGTAAGTYVIDINPGPDYSHPLLSKGIVVENAAIYFVSNNRLWRSDGTTQNTKVVADFEPSAMTYFKGWIYFLASSEGYGIEMFKVPFTKLDQSITFGPVPAKTMGDGAFTILASSTSGLPIVLSENSDKISVTNNTVTIVKAGSVTIKANQPGNTVFNAAPEISHTFCINPAKPAITTTDTSNGRPVLTSSSDEGNNWFLNDENLPAITSKTFIAEEEGIYTVQVVIDNCISAISEQMIVTITATEESHKKTFEIFPNPSSNLIRIKSDYNSGDSGVEILNVRGERVGNFNLFRNSEVEHDIRNYPSGVYIVKITSAAGVSFEKLVKE